jgi:uncharacterized C2H2 Zn-finger protein
MYKCNSCGAVFAAPKTYTEDYSKPYEACPWCGEGFSDAMRCPRCEDTYVSVEAKYPFCKECREELVEEYIEVLSSNFREDELDTLLELTECMSAKDFYKKED